MSPRGDDADRSELERRAQTARTKLDTVRTRLAAAQCENAGLREELIKLRNAYLSLASEKASTGEGLNDLDSRRWFFRIAADFAPLVAVEADDGVFLVPTRGAGGMGERLFSRGSYGSDLLPAALRAAAELGVDIEPGNATFIDAGANIGMVSIAAVRRYGFARAVAAEPHPTNARLLRANTILSGVVEQVTIVESALGAGDAFVQMPLEGESGKFQVLTHDSSGAATVDVRMRSLDSLMAEGTISAGETVFLWMDVQGFEGQVLRGAKSLSLPAVIMELWPSGLARHDRISDVCRLIEERFDVFVDLGKKDRAPMPVSAVADLADRIRDSHTDILLVKRPT